MPRTNGLYELPQPQNPVVTGTPIDSSDHNDTMNDVAIALTDSIAKNGETIITGPIDHDGNEIILSQDPNRTSIQATTDDVIDFKIGTILTTTIGDEGFQGNENILLASQVFD